MDARRRRSRDRLHRAALELAGSRPPGGLTMTAIAATAGVHRTTAHEHAAAPGELVRAALAEELDELRSGLPAVGDGPDEVARSVTRVTRGVVEHVARHAAVYRAGLSADEPAYGLHEMLSEHFRESSRILREVAGVRAQVDVPGQDPVEVARAAERFIADGTVGLLADWVQGERLSVEEFLRRYVALLPTWWPRDLALVAGASGRLG
ncbi:TetR/AcrR family transcriptional regulator [Nocardioides sambongensis]|uniref:TetR/AcrR family transcriptional regulator n=1 Tax=Nocardioides sambongensis TaxID=2589074 RepID=UPI001126CBA3|nr:TetR/AcrR family transcriptional regulator [Nocardioides sambongensis]